MSPSARCGTFFAELGFLASAFGLCIVTNSIAAGMDIAALCPKYINIRRGSYIITIIGVAVCPWKSVTRPTTFVTVLSGWSVFLSPMTGIFISNYFLVRNLIRQTPVERIMYSVDWPYSNKTQGLAFMQQLRQSGLVTEEQFEGIAYKNAQSLLKVQV